MTAQTRCSGLCSHPPALWVLFLASRTWSALSDLSAGGLLPGTVLAVGSLPRVVLLISMTVTAPFLRFEDLTMSSLCSSSSLRWLWWSAQMRLQAWLCGVFSARSSQSQNPFFLALPVFLTLRCSLRCLLDHFISGTGYCPFEDL